MIKTLANQRYMRASQTAKQREALNKDRIEVGRNVAFNSYRSAFIIQL